MLVEPSMGNYTSRFHIDKSVACLATFYIQRFARYTCVQKEMTSKIYNLSTEIQNFFIKLSHEYQKMTTVRCILEVGM
jgi:hypothetical protein